MHDLIGVEVVVLLGAVILACGVLARRLRMAPPILLLLSGVLLGFVPALREVHLPPEAMLLLFLPALLYWESLTTSLREIRNNLRAIMLLSTVLVVVTAGAVAVVMHALGLPWGPAWVLGAALAPTDAHRGGRAGPDPCRTAARRPRGPGRAGRRRPSPWTRCCSPAEGEHAGSAERDPHIDGDPPDLRRI